MKNEFTDLIEETRSLLKQNTEWKTRYKDYAECICENLDFIEGIRDSFREWNPLTVYINVTSAKKARTLVEFDLRYYGQNVAKLYGYKNGDLLISTNKSLDKTNQRDFDCGISLRRVEWTSPEAAEFRKFFKTRRGPRNNKGNKSNDEHRLESLWITELLKKGDKMLPNTRPVTIGKLRFSMPTPISASNHKEVRYAGNYGGGIDILARTGRGGFNTYPCIIELKDKNVTNEPPKDAIKQAIAYSTFIRELLRSDSGHMWWKLFGFNRDIPEQVSLYAACLMPSSDINDYSFQDMELNIDGDIIKLHYIYFKEDNNIITNVETSLRW